MTFEAPSSGPVYLSPLQAGRLRGVLKSALLDLDLLGGNRMPARVVLEPPSAVVPPQARRVVEMKGTTTRTVQDIAARLALSAEATGNTSENSPPSGDVRAMRERSVAWLRPVLFPAGRSLN